MRRRSTCLIVGILIASVPMTPGRAAADDAKDLQGTWEVVEVEANGEKKPADEHAGTRLTFKGTEVWVEKPTGTDPKLKFELDPAKGPKTIDLTVLEGDDRGKVVPGIYAVEADRLRLCINIFGDPSVRPGEFKTRDGDGVAYAVLKRAAGK